MGVRCSVYEFQVVRNTQEMGKTHHAAGVGFEPGFHKHLVFFGIFVHDRVFTAAATRACSYKSNI